MLYLLEAIHCNNNHIEDTRIFGIFTEDKLDELRNLITNNVSDLCEYYYRYIAIVRIPENTLYVNCYTKIFELYEVLLPQEYKDAVRSDKTYEECNEILKERFNEIKFGLVEPAEIPDYISTYFNRIDLDKEE